MFYAVLLLIPNISSSVNWGVPHGLHKIAPVSLSLTASIFRAHKLAYVPSLLFYTPWCSIRNGYLEERLHCKFVTNFLFECNCEILG
jgi:hypothetical protein